MSDTNSFFFYPRSLATAVKTMSDNAGKYKSGLITLGELCISLSHDGINVLSVSNDIIAGEVRLYEVSEETPVRISYNIKAGTIQLEMKLAEL